MRPEEFTDGVFRAASPVGPEAACPDRGGVSAGGRGAGVGTTGTSGVWTAEGAKTAGVEGVGAGGGVGAG
ncbi:MAG: hypothetical protein LBB52_05590, partial [Desulfovibrio sp.]|nr:hypothetical protein [Desulfovibrio sp.]